MLDACNGSPLEGAGERVGDISTVSQDVQPTLGPLESMEYDGEFGPLRRLVATIDGSMETVSVLKCNSPTCTGPNSGAATSPVSRHQCDFLGQECEWGPHESLSHVHTERARVVVGKYVARVSEAAWGVR